MRPTYMKNCLSSPWPALILITVLAGVIYSNIYHCPFVFDDASSIVENVKIRDLTNFFSFEAFLKSRSIVNHTLALNYRFGKLNVFGYHLINVLIHVINGIIVYFLALTIFKQLANVPQSSNPKIPQFLNSSIPQLISLFSALIFVAHPIQTQAVTYTVQRYASLAAMFYMGSVFFYLKARVRQQRSEVRGRRSEVRGHPGEMRSAVVNEFHRAGRSEGRGGFSFVLSAYFALSILCGLLAFMSKQNTASLPGAIILVEYLFIDRTWQGWKKKILWFTPAFILFTIFVLYVCGFFSGAHEGRGLLEDISDLMQETELVSRWSYLCTQFNVLVIYIRLLFLPIGQNLDYAYPFKSGFFDGYTPLAFMFLAGLAALGILNRKKRPIITFGIFWFFITLSVESGIIPIRDALFEHRLYLPMFGFALIVSCLLFYLLPKKRLWAVVISVSVIVSLGTATYLRNMIWQDGLTLWSDVVSKNPENHRGHYNMGHALARQGSLKEAIGHFSEAVRIKPNCAKAHYNLGNALERQGSLKEAIGHFSEAVRIKPNFVVGHYNLGHALARQGSLKEAIGHFSEAVRIKPNYTEARYNLGVVLARQGNLKEAIKHFSEALRIRPEDEKIHNSLGISLMLQGNLKEAARHFSEALRIKPDYGKARRNLESVRRYMQKTR